MALTKVTPALFATSNNITSTTVGGSANTVSLTFDGSGVITSATNNAISVANTAITGNIISSQITSVANTQITGNLTATNIAGGSNGTIPYQSASGTTQMLAVGTAGQLLQTNGAGAPTWATISSSPTIVRSARTSNTILGTADASTLIDITSGTFTQTFTAAATLGSGWFVYIRNSGTGEITLDPNSSETIDGLTSYIMYPGEVRLVQCTGTAFNTIVLNTFLATFTTSGTFTKPPGYSIFNALVWGGGGSGAKDNSACRGGFGGGCFPFQLLASTFGATETITIGAGGASVTTLGNGSNAGGQTLIGTLAKVGGADANMGGAVGDTGTYTTTTDVGGNFKNGMGFEGASVSAAGQISTIYGGAGNPTNAGAGGGSSIYGGAAGGGHDGTTARSGGTSTFGGNGGAASVTTNGTAGSAPAGGGGACKSSGNSGAGGRGEVRIWGSI